MDQYIKKCRICKQEIDLFNDNIDNFIIIQNGKIHNYYHKKCFINSKLLNKKNPLTINECNEIINDNKDHTLNYIQKLKNENNEKLKTNKERNIRLAVTDFIFDMYGITYLPNYFYLKLDSIYKGTYKNLNRPIPPEDLLDMWKRQKDSLNKLAENKRRRGEEITGINRIHFDLAVLMSHYDSYLKWKQERKNIISEDIERRNNNQKHIDYSNVMLNKHNTSKEDTIDVLSIISEI